MKDKCLFDSSHNRQKAGNPVGCPLDISVKVYHLPPFGVLLLIATQSRGEFLNYALFYEYS